GPSRYSSSRPAVVSRVSPNRRRNLTTTRVVDTSSWSTSPDASLRSRRTWAASIGMTSPLRSSPLLSCSKSIGNVDPAGRESETFPAPNVQDPAGSEPAGNVITISPVRLPPVSGAATGAASARVTHQTARTARTANNHLEPAKDEPSENDGVVVV